MVEDPACFSTILNYLTKRVRKHYLGPALILVQHLLRPRVCYNQDYHGRTVHFWGLLAKPGPKRGQAGGFSDTTE